jgi:hypothetical protein
MVICGAAQLRAPRFVVEAASPDPPKNRGK